VRQAELAERLGEELPRPVFAEQPSAAEDPETARIRSALPADVSAETSGAIAWGVSAETSEGQARALLADRLDWHRREDKPARWRYFYVRTLSPAELIGEPDALGGLTGGDARSAGGGAQVDAAALRVGGQDLGRTGQRADRDNPHRARQPW